MIAAKFHRFVKATTQKCPLSTHVQQDYPTKETTIKEMEQQ